MSAISRIDGPGGNAYVPRARNSLRMSFWVVPWSFDSSTPFSRATTMYSASSHAAVALIVIDVFISSSGMPSISACMSPLWAIGTPTLPTSPRDRGSSGS